MVSAVVTSERFFFYWQASLGDLERVDCRQVSFIYLFLMRAKTLLIKFLVNISLEQTRETENSGCYCNLSVPAIHWCWCETTQGKLNKVLDLRGLTQEKEKMLYLCWKLQAEV